MHISKYKVFSTVARTESFTQAADLLGYTQSGISHIIRSLEQEYGITLFHRDKNKLTLTPEARLLLEPVEQIVNWEDSLDHTLQNILNLDYGELSIGTCTSVSVRYIPRILEIFTADHTHVRYHLIDNNHETIERMLLARRLDCAFLPRPSSEALNYTPLIRNRYYAVLHPSSRYAKLPVIPLSAFADEPFIFPGEGHGYDLTRLFQHHRITPNICSSEKDDLGTLSLVEAGIGNTVLTDLMLECYPPKKVVIRPLECEAWRQIGLAFPKDRTQSPLTKAFIDAALRYFS